MSEIVLRPMTADEASEWKLKVGGAANRLRVLLFEGYERDAWRVLGYPNWTDCLQSLSEEYGYSERHLWRLHDANQTEKLLTQGSVGELPERVLRPLSGLEPEKQIEAWQEAKASAPGGKVTATHVEAVAARHRPAPPPPQVLTNITDQHRTHERTYDAALPVFTPPAERPRPVTSRPLTDNEVEAVIWRAIAHHAKSGMTHHKLAWLQAAEIGDFSRLLNPGVSFDAEQLARIRGEVEAELGKQVTPAPTNGTKMAVHFSSDNPEHYTPAEIIAATVKCMGAIDLDPCSNSKTAPNVPALDHFTADDDGLSRPWFGRVYMNSPYGRVIPDWVTKLKSEFDAGNVTEAIALVPARTDTQWWRTLRDYPVCLVTGRLVFVNNDDPAPFPSAVFYLGKDVAKFSRCFGHLGDIWRRIDV